MKNFFRILSIWSSLSLRKQLKKKQISNFCLRKSKVHNESPTQIKVLIDQNEKALRMVQELTSIPISMEIIWIFLWKLKNQTHKIADDSGEQQSSGRKSLIISSSSASSLGNHHNSVCSPHQPFSAAADGGMLQKNHSLHAFPNGYF